MRCVTQLLARDSGRRFRERGCGPLSREQHPKQFLRVIGDKSMLQHTLARLDGLAHEAPVIVCHHDHRFLVAEQCREQDIRPRAIMLEPAPRNTAPALALAAFSALAAGDPVLLALPADAYIGDIEAFHVAVEMALPFAASGSVVTFGITPSRAETGYGYIRAGATLPNGKGVAQGRQPSPRSRRQAWRNSTWPPATTIGTAACSWFAPASIWTNCAPSARTSTQLALPPWPRNTGDLDFHRPGDAFLDRPGGLHRLRGDGEHAACRWWCRPTWRGPDVGSWRTLAETLRRDDNGNTASGDVIALGTRNCYLGRE